MKLQNLIIIFIIIIIPIVLVFSYYLGLESKTIAKQTEYDEKLIEATKEALEAFEINTAELNSKYSTLANSKRRDITSSINTFTESLANKLGIGGTSKENILNYVPAIVYVMYDGYYIYTPTYIPKSLTNENGVQLFYYANAKKYGKAEVFESATQVLNGNNTAGEPIYISKDGTGNVEYNGKRYTTDIEKSEKQYKHMLKTFVPYTANFESNGVGYVVNYTLDNYLKIYAKRSESQYQIREGYYDQKLCDKVTIGFSSTEVPVTVTTDSGKTIQILPELITENVAIGTGENQKIEEYPYIYNSNNDKKYYDSSNDKFFMVDSNYQKVYLPDVDATSSLAEFKKVLVKTDQMNSIYLELYQLLNRNEGNKWYYIDENGQFAEAKEFKIRINRNYDCSAVNYYVKNYCFNKWIKDSATRKKNIETLYNSKNNNIRTNIEENLKLSMANYSSNSKIDYKLIQLSDEDWEQALSDVSIITFFQGMPIGLKNYNNYSIVTSTNNKEFINEDKLYYYETVADTYHTAFCDALINSSQHTIKGYPIVEYEYAKNTDDNTYFLHGTKTACYKCIVNENKYNRTQARQLMEQVEYTTLARERYRLDDSTPPLLAEWTEDTYIIDYNANGGTGAPDGQIKIHDIPLKLRTKIPARVGYGFQGWSDGNQTYPSGGIYTNNESTTLYAVWKINTYTITYNANGGSGAPASQIKEYGKNIKLSIQKPVRERHDFLGWALGKDSNNVIYKPGDTYTSNADITLYAVWNRRQHTVSYDLAGGKLGQGETLTSSTINEGEEATVTSIVPTKPGYEFVGWANSVDNKTYKKGQKFVVERDVTLKAQWKARQYTVAYNANGGTGTMATDTISYGQNYVTKSNGFSWPGHTFKGWNEQANGRGTSWTNYIGKNWTWTYTKNITLYAQWEANRYTVAYNANGGTGTMATDTISYGQNYVTKSNGFSWPGHTFKGWNEQANGRGTSWTNYIGKNWTWTYTKNITLYAQWEANEYTITYNANGGSVYPTSQQVRYGANFTVPRPTRAGYNFVGWRESNGGKRYEAGGTYTYQDTRSITLIAEWTSATYTITYNANGGSVYPSSQQVRYGANFTTPTPRKSGARFNGWSGSNGKRYQAGGTYTYNDTSNITLTANWKQEYTITYDANGGTGAPGSQIKVEGETLYLSSKAPTRRSYTFQYWKSRATGANYSPGGTYTNNTSDTLVAVWQAINVTEITINQSGDQWIPTKTDRNNQPYTTLTAQISPADALNKGVTWSSDNTTVATVNSSGTVTAKGPGYAVITATASGNTSKTSSRIVYVYNAVYDWPWGYNRINNGNAKDGRDLYYGTEVKRNEKFPAMKDGEVDYLILKEGTAGGNTYSYYKILYSRYHSNLANAGYTNTIFFRTNKNNGVNLCTTFFDEDTIK